MKEPDLEQTLSFHMKCGLLSHMCMQSSHGPMQDECI